jgi:hypothetical protein
MIKFNDDSIVGHFIPSSDLVVDGLALTAGKIDKQFGNLGPAKGYKPEMVRFGLKNNTVNNFLLKPMYRIAHLELFDLRGLSSEKVQLSETEKNKIIRRHLRAIEDGITYE